MGQCANHWDHSCSLWVYYGNISSQSCRWHISAYIKNSLYSLFTPEQIKEGNLYQKEHQLLDDHPSMYQLWDPSFMPSFGLVLQRILWMHKSLLETCFKLPCWVATPLCSKWKCQFFSLWVIHQAAHDKLCGLWISTKAQLICQMCNTSKDKFCKPEPIHTLGFPDIAETSGQWTVTWDTTLVWTMQYCPCSFVSQGTWIWPSHRKHFMWSVWVTNLLPTQLELVKMTCSSWS